MNKKKQEKVYQASKWTLADVFKELIENVQNSPYLAWRLFVRDFSAAYRQSILGYFWALVPTIIMALTLSAAVNEKVIQFEETKVPYTAFVIISITLWQIFLESLNAPIIAVTNAKGLIAKIFFPHEALIFAKLIEVAVNALIKFPLIIGSIVVYKIQIGFEAFAAFFSVIALVMLGLTIGILLAPISLIYQDVSKGINIITGVLLFLTPVLYPLPNSGKIAQIIALNPITPVLVTTRELLTGMPVSNWFGFVLVACITVIIAVSAWITYRIALPFAIERISS